MAEQVDQWFPAALDVPRGLGCDELTSRMSVPKNAASCGCSLSVPEAVSAALSEARESDMVLIFGSFFTVAAAREVLM
jgi:dihydrofolate synthase/folylpolyglutamate synthase